ncbi:MAG: CPBP family intramembrane metalloprotease [Lachnospiraceae bacterium]|nr:CPBP family intramembrane metalloprotease [Lachnospiraceae bacterium]
MKQGQRGQTIYKAWEVFGPFITYYFTYNAAFLLIAYLCSVAMGYFGTGLQEYMTTHEATLTSVVSGLSMLIGILPLIPMLRRELVICKENADDKAPVATEGGTVRQKAVNIVLAVILAASSSVGLNVLLTLTGFVQTSEVYRDVARQQYGVIFGIGAILFGLISPITEEIVFRGLVFNRMRRYYPTMVAIVMSGVLFGVYHGNLVQGVYGGCMGILLAYTYERIRSFLVPCLFHATANLMVYSLAQNAELHARLFNVTGCVILFAISVICIFVIEKLRKRDNVL